MIRQSERIQIYSQSSQTPLTDCLVLSADINILGDDLMEFTSAVSFCLLRVFDLTANKFVTIDLNIMK